MRLIDAHKVLDYIETNKDTVDIVDIVESIIMSPTVDAVPVIRCGSCVYCKNFNDLWYQPIKDTHVCKISGLETTPLDYCSKAERKEE